MFASTSRVILEPSSRLLPSSRSSGFSSSAASSSSRRQAIVELLKDVEGLGKAFDRVKVAPGRARNSLVPNRFARFIPVARGVDQTLSRQPTFADEPSLTPEFRIEGPGRPILRRTVFTPKETPQSLLNALFSLPPKLTFPLRTIDAQTPTLYGALTLDDIHNRLEREFGLLRSMVTVSWEEGKDAERLKELQTKKAFVEVIGEGKEVAPVDIEVVRLEEGEHATS